MIMNKCVCSQASSLNIITVCKEITLMIITTIITKAKHV